MGILNVTPDSFSDGGRFTDLPSAIEQARRMVDEGADLIDVGGESTRPGASAVSEDEEIARVIPVVSALERELPVPISVDTSKPEVMRAAADAGAGMINDVRALREPGSLEAARATGLPVCLMHMRGEPRTMQVAPTYRNVVLEVREFLLERIRACVDAGIDRKLLLVDPGIGFGKTLDHNLQLLKYLDALAVLEAPILVGVSRKSMIGSLLGGAPVQARLHGTIAAVVLAAAAGAAVVRVHDVAATRESLAVATAILQVQKPEGGVS